LSRGEMCAKELLSVMMGRQGGNMQVSTCSLDECHLEPYCEHF
jgi:hypothetical protein